MECSTTDNMLDWADSQPTPAQRPSSDSSQTKIKQLFVSEGHRVDVNEANVDEIYDNLNETNSKIVALQDLFNSHPKNEFISTLIANVSSDEVQLEELRETLFSEVRRLRDYPYPTSAEMKRRIRRSRGETIAYKFALDIYHLVNVLDGGSFDEIQNILSFPKTPSRSEFNSSLCGTQRNAANIDVLSSSVVQIQADLIKVKQDNTSVSEKLTEEISSLKSSLSKMQHETSVLFETLKSLIAENTQSIDRVASERSSGIAKLRSDIKVIWSEVDSNRDGIEQHVRESRDTVSNHTKTVDKRLGKLEQRLKSLNNDVTLQKTIERPDFVSVGTQVSDEDLGVKATKCCSHDCMRSLRKEHCDLDNSGESLLIVSEDIPEQSDPRIINDRASYSDRLMNRVPASRPIGSSTPSLGGQLVYTVCEQNGPRFIRADGAPAIQPNRAFKDTSQAQCGENGSSFPIPKNSTTADKRQDLPRAAPHNLPSGARQNQAHIKPAQSTVQRNAPLPAQQSNSQHAIQDLPRSDQRTLPRSTTNTRTDSVPQRIPTRISRIDDVHNDRLHDIDDFILHVRKKTRRFYVGSFTPGISEQSIRAFIKDKNGPKVDKINFFNQRNGSDVYLRICVESENSNVLTDPDFWPDDVHCRPWFSRNAYMRNVRQSRNAAEARSEDQGQSQNIHGY